MYLYSIIHFLFFYLLLKFFFFKFQFQGDLNLEKMTNEDNVCWYHEDLTRDGAVDLLKRGKFLCVGKYYIEMFLVNRRFFGCLGIER